MSKAATVFVIDDDPDVCQSVCALAESMHVRSEAFATAEAFLESYVESAPGCIVADVRLVGMSGLERLARERITLPIVLATGCANIPLTVAAMQKGAVTLLEKPCTSHELGDAICKALRRDAEIRAQMARQRELRDRLGTLTEDERQVMQMMIKGEPNKRIAMRQEVSLRTIENRRKRVMQKMGAESLAELVRIALETESLQTTMAPRGPTED